MKSIARFLLVVCSFAPVIANGAPVSQTAGSNLTGYNGSLGNVVGNQWNTMTNPRNAPNTAKADYGNCNALILRCASPKCSGGGCADMNVAKSIALGCVNANASCKKYGEELAGYIAGQLVSDSVAAANKSSAAAAASAAAEQNAAMQQQMSQMQQQMAAMQQQNNQQLASLQSALAESQRSNQSAAVTTTTATSVARDEETGLTKTQEIAAKSGVSDDIIARATISGQILSSIEGVDISLSRLKSNMRDAFRYGGCNEINGNSCKGPKRVKKFRELATKFFEPYDELGNSLEEALFKAQSVGVDLGNVYMFFSGSCNRWAEYICRGNYSEKCTGEGNNKVCESGLPVYSCAAQVAYMPTYTIGGQTRIAFSDAERDISLQQSVQKALSKTVAPALLQDHTNQNSNFNNILNNGGALLHNLFISEAYASNIIPASCDCEKHKSISNNGVTRGGHDCYSGQVIPPEDLVACSVNRFLSFDNDVDAVTQKILNPDATSTGSVRVGCASDLSNGIIKRRSSSSKTGGVDIDLLEIMVTQHEVSDKKEENSYKSCFTKDADTAIETLESAVIKKTLGKKCCETLSACNVDCYDMTKDVSYVAPEFALCDVHAWNAGFVDNDEALANSSTKEKMEKIIGLKTTVIAQQMYKQYSSLEAVIRQLKVLLEKEALKASLQVAGASSSGADDDSGSAASAQFDKCSTFDEEAALSCLTSNYAKLSEFVEKGNLRTDVKKQLKSDNYALSILLADDKSYTVDCQKESSITSGNAQGCLDNIGKGITKLKALIRKNKQSNNGFYLPYGNGNG